MSNYLIENVEKEDGEDLLCISRVAWSTLKCLSLNNPKYFIVDHKTRLHMSSYTSFSTFSLK